MTGLSSQDFTIIAGAPAHIEHGIVDLAEHGHEHLDLPGIEAREQAGSKFERLGRYAGVKPASLRAQPDKVGSPAVAICWVRARCRRPIRWAMAA